MADTIDLRDYLSPEDYAALHPEAAADPEKKNLIPNPTDGTTTLTDPTSGSMPTNGIVPTPISQDVQLTPEQIAAQPAQIPQGVDFSASASTLPQPSTDLPLIPTVSSGTGGSDLQVPNDLIAQYSKEAMNSALPNRDSMGNVVIPMPELADKDGSEQKIEILAGKNSESKNISPNTAAPEGDAIINGIAINKEFLPQQKSDTEMKADDEFFKNNGKQDYYNKIHEFKDGEDIWIDKNIGNLQGKSYVDDILQKEKEGKAEVARNSKGELIDKNQNPITDGSNILWRPKGKDEIDRYNESARKYNQGTEDANFDASEHNYGQMFKPEGAVSSLTQLSRQYYAATGKPMTQDQIDSVATNEGLQSIQSEIGIAKIQKENPNLTPEQAAAKYNESNADKSATIYQSNTRWLMGKFLEGALSQQNNQEAVGDVHSVRLQNAQDQPELDFYRSIYNNPTGELAESFGKWWDNEGQWKYGTSEQMIQLNSTNQKDRAQIANDFLNYYSNSNRIQNEALQQSINNKRMEVQNAAEQGNAQRVAVLTQSLQNDFARKKQLEAAAQIHADLSKEINSKFVTLNEINKEKAQFQGKLLSGDLIANTENLLAQAAFGVTDAFKETALGANRLLTSWTGDRNHEDWLNYMTEHNGDNMGSATPDELKSTKTFYTDTRNGKKFADVDGQMYMVDNGTYVPVRDYDDSFLKQTNHSEDFNAGGVVRHISKFIAVLPMAEGMGGVIMEPLTTGAKYLADIASTAKEASSMMKLAEDIGSIRGISTEAAKDTWTYHNAIGKAESAGKAFGEESVTAANFRNFAKFASSPEIHNSAGFYSNMYNNGFYEARKQGMSVTEANIYTNVQSALFSLAMHFNPAKEFWNSGATGLGSVTKSLLKGEVSTAKKEAVDFFTSLYQNAGHAIKFSAEMGAVGLAQKTVDMIFNSATKSNFNTDAKFNLKDELITNVLPSMVMGMAGYAREKITPSEFAKMTRPEIIAHLASDPNILNALSEYKNNHVYFGNITDAVSSLQGEIATVQNYRKSIPNPEKYSDAATYNAAMLLQKIDAKKRELNSTDDTFKPRIQDEIKNLQETVNKVLDDDLAKQKINLNAKTGEEVYQNTQPEPQQEGVQTEEPAVANQEPAAEPIINEPQTKIDGQNTIQEQGGDAQSQGTEQGGGEAGQGASNQLPEIPEGDQKPEQAAGTDTPEEKVDYSHIKPIGKGFFGNIYDQFRGRAKDAVNFLLQKKEGDIIGALNHKDVGDIDLVWGNSKTGLKKISEKHPEVLNNLQERLDNTRIVSNTDEKIKLESDKDFFVIAKHHYGNEKRWLITAYELKEKPASASSMDNETEPETGKQIDTAPLQSGKELLFSGKSSPDTAVATESDFQNQQTQGNADQPSPTENNNSDANLQNSNQNNTKNEDAKSQDTENTQPEQDRTLHRDSADETRKPGGENKGEGREAAEVQKVTEDYTDEDGDTVPAEYLNLWLNLIPEGGATDGAQQQRNVESPTKPSFPTIEHNGKTYENRDGEYYAADKKGVVRKVVKPETIAALDEKLGIEKYQTSNPNYSIKKTTTERGAVHFDFVDNKTGVKVNPSEKTRQKYILEHITKQEYPETEIHPAASYQDGTRQILQESSNPYELASELARLPKYEDKTGTKEWFIATTFRRINPESYKRFGDRNNIGIGMAKAYFAKKEKSTPQSTIDRWAFDADSKKMDGDYGGDGITVDDVVNFINENRNGAEAYLRTPNPEYRDAAERFRQITGLNPSQKVLETLLNSGSEEDYAPRREKAESEYNRLSAESQGRLALEYEDWFKSLTLEHKQEELINTYPYEILGILEKTPAERQPQPADGQREGSPNADDKGGAGTKGQRTDSPEYRQAVAERDAAERRVAAAREKLAKVNRETSKDFADDQTDLFGERKTDANPSLFEERASGEAGKKIIADARAELEAARKEFSATNQRVRDFESGKTKGTEEIQFSIANDKNLVALHNISENNLKKVLGNDAIPVPSIAVVKKGMHFGNFGEITLIGDVSLGDPKSSKNKIFGGDAYTPRYPRVETFFKNRAEEKRFEKDILNLLDDRSNQYYVNTKSVLDGYGDTATEFAYLNEKGIPYTKDDAYKVKRDYFSKLENRNDFSEWISKKLSDYSTEQKIPNGNTPSGNWKYLPHTIENVVKIMTKKSRGGEDFNYGGIAPIRAQATRQFKSLAELKSHSDKLVSGEDFQKIKDEINTEYDALKSEFADSIKNQYDFMAFDEMLKDFAKGGVKELDYYLKEKPSAEQFEKLTDFIFKLKNLATEYFEAKPQRAVGLYEFGAAVVPKGTSENIINQLKSKGLKIYTYDTPSERSAIVEKAALENDLVFHKGNAEVENLSRPEFDKLIDKLKVPFENAFGKLNVTTDYEVAKARAKELGENVNDIELKTAGGNVYGFKLSDGTLYFNPEKLNANTAFHEFSHLWEQLMPKAWAKGVEIFKETSAGKKIFEQLKSEGNYSKLSEEKLWSEAMNTHIGQKGDESYRNPKGKMAEFVQWMKDIVAKIGEVTGVNKLLDRNLTPDDKLGIFTRGVLGDLTGGKELKAKSGAEPYKNIQFSKLDENEKEQVEKVSAIAKIERKEPIKIQPKDNHKDIEAIYKSLGEVKNKEDGRNIGIANSVYGKIIRHKGFDYKRIIPQLDKIIEDAVPIYFELHRNRETHTNIVGMHNYLSKIEVDGREYYVRISAQEMVPSRKLGENVGQSILHSTYVSDIEIYKSDKPSVTTGITSPATTTAPVGLVDAKLKEFFDSAKDSYEKYKSLLDEKGNIINNGSGVDYHIQSPHKTIPAKTFREVSEAFKNEGEEGAMGKLRESAWWNGASDKAKAEAETSGIHNFMYDQARKIAENKDMQKSNAVERTRLAGEKKVAEKKEEFKKKISDIKDAYAQKIEEFKQEETDHKAKFKLRADAQKQVAEDLKQYVLSNPITESLTPSQTNRLIRMAADLARPKRNISDVHKALDEFQKVYDKAKSDAESQKTQKQTKQEVLADVQNKLASGILPEDMPSAEKQRVAERLKEREVAQSVSGEDALKIQDEAFQKEKDLHNRNKLDIRKAFKEKQYRKEFLDAIKDRNREKARKVIEKFSDRQFVPKELLKQSGMERTYDRMINHLGASGRAKSWMEEADHKVFKGLYGEDYENLNKIIDSRSTISLDSYREQERLPPIDHHNGYNGVLAEKALEAMKAKMGDKKFNDLMKRADDYYGTYHDVVKKLKEGGLISSDTADILLSREYSPRYFLEHLKDYEGDIDRQHSELFKAGGAGLSKGALKALDEGSKGEKVNDASFLMNNYMGKMSEMLSMNEVNKTFMEREFPAAKAKWEALQGKPKDQWTKDEARFNKYFSELKSKVRENPITGVTENGNFKYRYDETPQGFSKNYYYKDGVKHEFFLSDELHNQWNDLIKGLKWDKEVVAIASGSALVKNFATGNNPFFFLSNTPRDFLQTALVSDEYSAIMPKAWVQIGSDAVKGFREAMRHDAGKTNGDGLLDKYIEYGGMMDFLNQQGMVKKEGFVDKKMEQAIGGKNKDTARNIFKIITLKKLNEYSEITFRLGTMNRTLTNGLKEYNKAQGTNYKTVEEIPDAQVRDDMYYRAVREARSVLDFNQGGTITKDAEAVLPYTNAGAQGMRVVADAMRRNPLKMSAKILQTASILTAAPAAMALGLISMFKSDDDKDKSAYDIYTEALDNTNSFVRRGNFVIPTPFKDEKGNYHIITFAKTQELQPFFTLFELTQENLIRKMSGKEELKWDYILGQVNKSADNAMVVNPFHNPFGENSQVIDMASKMPILKGVLAVGFGVNSFTKDKVTYDVGKTTVKNEGMADDRIEDFYKTIAPKFDMSPARTKALVESMMTQPTTNPWVGLIYGGADFVTGNFDASKLQKDEMKALRQRVFRDTSDFNRMQNMEDRHQSEIDNARDEGNDGHNALNKIAKATYQMQGDKAREYANQQVAAMKLNDSEREKAMKCIAKKWKENNTVSTTTKYDAMLRQVQGEQTPKAKAERLRAYFGKEIPQQAIERGKQFGRIFTPEVKSAYDAISQ